MLREIRTTNIRMNYVKRVNIMTNRQQIFVEEYLQDFNATQAAIRAGYSKKTARAIAAENLTKPDISVAINTALNERKNALVADRQSRQIFWTSIMNDEKLDLKHRLRASELLAKSEGDFIEKAKIEADVKGETLADFLLNFYSKK